MYMTIQMYDSTVFVGKVSEVRLDPDVLTVVMADGSHRRYMSRLVIGMTILDGETWKHEVC